MIKKSGFTGIADEVFLVEECVRLLEAVRGKPGVASGQVDRLTGPVAERDLLHRGG